MSRKGIQAPDQYKHVILSEESIINLILKCEPLDKDLVDQLVESIKETNFDSLKLKLYEKQEAYTKCLKLLLETDTSQSFITVKMQDRFQWIVQTHFKLEQRLGSKNENTHNRYQFDLFQQEIFTFAPLLVKIDTHKAVGLVTALFGDDLEEHLKFIKKMDKNPAEQYMYTTKILDIRYEQVKTVVQEYLMHKTQARDALLWLEILNLNLELACQIEPDQVLFMVKKAIKSNFHPMEECLKIC